MAKRIQKISRDTATNESSVDSLSFANLVCIHEQQKKPPTKAAKQDTEFEFFSIALNPSTKIDHQGQGKANISVSNGSIRHKEFLLQYKQSQPASPAHSGVLLQEYLGNEKSTYRKDRHRDRENHPTRGSQNKQKTANADNRSSDSGFGQKLLLSFISPCRDCHASNPKVKTPNKVNKQRSY